MHKVDSRRYHISLVGRPGHSFVLNDGGEILGALSIRGVHASSATIKVDEAELDVSRTAPFRKNLALCRQSDSEAICFSANLFSGGKLDTHGGEYYWTPVNLHWSTWAWKDRRGKTLMKIRLRHSFSDPRGDVRSSEPLTELWQKELALLGWYLLSLNQASFGTHALSALKNYTGQTSLI